jgi:hypothetical protein
MNACDVETRREAVEFARSVVHHGGGEYPVSPQDFQRLADRARATEGNHGAGRSRLKKTAQRPPEEQSSGLVEVGGCGDGGGGDRGGGGFRGFVRPRGVLTHGAVVTGMAVAQDVRHVRVKSADAVVTFAAQNVADSALRAGHAGDARASVAVVAFRWLFLRHAFAGPRKKEKQRLK